MMESENSTPNSSSFTNGRPLKEGGGSHTTTGLDYCLFNRTLQGVVVQTCHRYLRKIHAQKVSTNLAPEKDHIVDNN